MLDDGVLGDALRAVAVAGLEQRREHRRQRRALVARTHVRLERHRHVERHGDGAHQPLVVAGGQRRRPAARIGNAQRLQHGGDVQLLEGIVVEALVAQIKDEVGAQLRQVALERRVVVEVAELVVGQLGERVLQAADGLHVLRVERAAALHRVGQARIAHHAP